MQSFTEHANDINAKKALDYARKAHFGQTRSDGSEYIKHPEKVAAYVQQFKKSNNLASLIAAAYLHDTIEDTDTTHEDLERMFGGLVASLVLSLTSDKEEIAKIGKTAYLSKKMATMSSWALVVKLSDRLDNVQDIATAKTPEWRKSYKQQTLDMLDNLEKARVLSGSHKKIISAIREKLNEIE